MSRTDSPAQASAAGQPAWVEPELATLTKDRFSDPAWLYERKFDGERCLAYRAGDQARLLTRNQKQVNGTYPELAAALQAQDCTDFICRWRGGRVRGHGHKLQPAAAPARGA